MSIIGFVRPIFLRRVRSLSFLVHFNVPSRQAATGLRSHSEARARLDQVAGVLVFNDDAAFRRVAAASAAVNQESRSAAHVVGRVWVENVAVGHALKGHHVAQAVLTLRKGADGNLALTAGVVSATTGLAGASFGGIDHGTVEAHTFEVVGALGVGIGASSLEVTSRDLDLVAFLLVKNRDRDEENEGGPKRKTLRRLILDSQDFCKRSLSHTMHYGHTINHTHLMEREIVADKTLDMTGPFARVSYLPWHHAH